MMRFIRKRLENQEGFTLIELMVVVLIIAILIAIAIPTFLGARRRAQDRQAQSNLRNALTAQKTYYTDPQVYLSDDVPADETTLEGIESNLDWNNPIARERGADVTFVGADGQTLVIQSDSASGQTFCLGDSAQTGAALAAGPMATAGTFYQVIVGGGACPDNTDLGWMVTTDGWNY